MHYLLQVNLAVDKSLVAMEAGRVIISKEKLSPYPRSPLYNLVSKGSVFEKIFFHVIPDEQEKRFRLVSQT